MKEILKYYKLLFTLPPNEAIFVSLLASYAVLGLKKELLVLALVQQAYFTILFYENRILNGRRLGFLYAVSNVLMLAKPELSVALYSMVSVLAIAHPLIEIVAILPLIPFFPKSLLALLPVWLVSTYGHVKGVMPLGIAWLRAWMGDDYVHLEEIVTKYGKKRIAKVLSLGPITFTDVHFGLMRYSMGTLFPYLLFVNGRIPHRLCGSHENNPANRWETFKLALKVAKGEEDSKNVIEVRKEEGEEIECLGLNGIKVIYHKNGADDLECGDYGVEIADPHNNEGEPVKAEVLEKELRNLKEIWKDECVFESVKEVQVNGKGLCWDKGILLNLSCERGTRSWLVVFGNNMRRGNRDELVREGLMEVSTLDDHTCAGFGRTKYEVSDVKSFEVLRNLSLSNSYRRREIEYLSMGDLIYKKEVRSNITNAIKLGVIGSFLTVVLSALV
ncbi:hypothetical protein EYM_01985 [Ignicoccus islandicus DSM 13165]|uniref:DUF2070 domain-containing protein n=1 Tax=Ignicoccus islandicus DSM 13165 TaxID=940295 RepID=A0A0U3FPR3_9CREN|nr:DUF2070 family protein [Ignicoccus islandicus]ALU12271.1 hypothetical protein EYM_01985 [Ignicoccus islandicus DSM 13165]